MEEYTIKKENVLSNFSNDQLIAVIAAWNTSLPHWLLEMRTQEVPKPEGLVVGVAWAELLSRSQKTKEVVTVKGTVEAMTTDKVLLYSPAAIDIIHSDGKTEKVVNHAGHLVREARIEDKSFNALITAENIIDAMMFPIQKYDGNKNSIEFSDRAQVGVLGFPEFPIMELMVNLKLTDPAKVRLKFMTDAAKHGVGKFVEKVIENFPERMVYKGMGTFAVNKAQVYSSNGNVSQMFKQISLSRKVRGNDNNANSILTRGYYYGYMSAPMYRTFHTVSDVIRVLRATGITVLRINRQAGIFNSSVVWSLVANGIYIHCESDNHLEVCDLTKGVYFKPGVYRKVITNGNVLRYFELNDRYPDTNSSVAYSAPVLDRLNDLGGTSNIKHFTILYLREELRDCADHLLASAHAHSGQVIWFQDAFSESLNFEDYMKRVVAATSYKCYAAYCRKPWILQDPYAYEKPFRITQKSIRNFEEFEQKKFTISDELIAQFSYDNELGELSERVRGVYLALAKGDTEEIKVLVEQKKVTYFANEDDNGPIADDADKGVTDGFDLSNVDL